VDFQVARVAVDAFAQDLCAVEEGFAVADVGVAGEAANVAKAVGGAVAVGFAFANVGVGGKAETAAVTATLQGNTTATAATVLFAVDLTPGFCRLEGFFAFDVQDGDGATTQVRAGYVEGAVCPFATDAEVDAAVARQLAAL
jgi:hypothetical protein